MVTVASVTQGSVPRVNTQKERDIASSIYFAPLCSWFFAVHLLLFLFNMLFSQLPHYYRFLCITKQNQALYMYRCAVRTLDK
ncbi:hypothetical protein GDO78_008082 [Eleutherodactylus coqui]|uniref:Uncharacterized protein n=1 Tax=Eleutherodactylus coqui TaxID=57060 RepID=A0A8J6FC00_ELECQ|nr:hypothetical protein GDO78_008082 [Eleutherodactylus coqui]